MINNILVIRTKVLFDGRVDYGIIRDFDMKITDKDKIAKQVHKILPNILAKLELGVPDNASLIYNVTTSDLGVMEIKIGNGMAELYLIELCLINLNQVVKPKIITLN